jgi:hypothetical protein
MQYLWQVTTQVLSKAVAKCYGFNVECLSQVHVLNTWSTAGGTEVWKMLGGMA